MKLPQRRRRPPQEPVVPLINVVFLLLVFFLLTGSLGARDVLRVEAPVREATGAERGAEPRATLWLDAQGRMASAEGPLARDGIASWWRAREPGDGPLLLRADAALPARHLLPLLEDLERAGVRDVTLAARPKR